MKKKHYEAIAKIIEPFWFNDLDSPTATAIARRLADYFEQDNPRFDRARFLQACGVETKTDSCSHLVTVAKYKDGKLQGYQCTGCRKLVPVNPQYQKRAKLAKHAK